MILLYLDWESLRNTNKALLNKEATRRTYAMFACYSEDKGSYCRPLFWKILSQELLPGSDTK